MTTLTLNEYQDYAKKTAIYPRQTAIDGLVYSVLALCGEAGELANKLKKHLRAGTPIDGDVLIDELGDVLWYVASVAGELKFELGTVAERNLLKIQERGRQNKIVG